MNVDNAVKDSPSLQLPDVLEPPLRENKVGPVSVSWQLPLWSTSLLGLVHAFNMESMKQMRAMLHNKIT